MSVLVSPGSDAVAWNAFSDASEECTASIFKVEKEHGHVSGVLVYYGCNCRENIWNEVPITSKSTIATLVYRLRAVARLCIGNTIKCI
jgi:hypothetical protein